MSLFVRRTKWTCQWGNDSRRQWLWSYTRTAYNSGRGRSPMRTGMFKRGVFSELPNALAFGHFDTQTGVARRRGLFGMS
jgi:hypothetical protein